MNTHPLQPNLQFGPPRPSPRFWIALVLTGIATGIAGGLLMRLLHWVEAEAWPAYRQSRDFLAAVEATTVGRRLAVLALAALLAGAVRRALSRRKVRAHGGDVVEAIWLGSGLIAPVRTLINSVLSMVVVGMGAALGREGAIKHAGAAIASWLCVREKLHPDQRRLLVACGAGAGLAAAYNVPFGGALFAMEVLLGSLALPQVIPALLTSLIATVVSWWFLPNGPVYPIMIAQVSAAQIGWAAVAGPLLGLASVLYIRAIAWADQQTHQGWRALAAPAGALLTLGLISLAVPEVLGNGKDVVAGAWTGGFGPGLLLGLVCLRPLGTILCLSGGVPGGLFTPTLACGALLGEAGGRLASRFVSGIDPAASAVIAAGAFVAAATEGPVSAIVLILELTRQVNCLIVPLLLAVAGANLAARSLEQRSIYSARIRIKPSGDVVPSPAERGTSHPR